MTFATYGVGFFLGSLVSGQIVDQFRLGENAHDWLPVWLIPAGFAALVALGFLLFFRESRSEADAG
jgi:MFS family permease